MLRLLLIQSRSDPAGVERERNNFLRAIGDAVQLHFLSALDEDAAWETPEEILKNYDAIIFGGSADFDLHGGRSETDHARSTARKILSRVTPLVRKAFSQDTPVLGICFGHQMIAEIHGGQVQHDRSQGKFGAHEVHLTEDGQSDDFFNKLPQSFRAQYEHKDSVTTLPEGATLLATGSSCRFSALRYGACAYTMQFHPELNRTPQPLEATRILPLWVEWINAD